MTCCARKFLASLSGFDPPPPPPRRAIDTPVDGVAAAIRIQACQHGRCAAFSYSPSIAEWTYDPHNYRHLIPRVSEQAGAVEWGDVVPPKSSSRTAQSCISSRTLLRTSSSSCSRRSSRPLRRRPSLRNHPPVRARRNLRQVCPHEVRLDQSGAQSAQTPHGCQPVVPVAAAPSGESSRPTPTAAQGARLAWPPLPPPTPRAPRAPQRWRRRCARRWRSWRRSWPRRWAAAPPCSRVWVHCTHAGGSSAGAPPAELAARSQSLACALARAWARLSAARGATTGGSSSCARRRQQQGQLSEASSLARGGERACMHARGENGIGHNKN
jgi:hypothetical protein